MGALAAYFALRNFIPELDALAGVSILSVGITAENSPLTTFATATIVNDIYLFFFAIGIPASIPMVLKNSPLLLVFALIIVLVHMLICFVEYP